MGFILEHHLEVGGSFQQPLNDLLWLERWSLQTDNEVSFFCFHPANIRVLADFGIKAELLRIGILDKLFFILKYFQIFDLLQISLRLRSPFEKRLIKSGIDIVYFATPSKWHFLLNKLPFVFTVFDGCHRDAPEFEEVSVFGEFERREKLFRSGTTKSAVVVTNAKEIVETLGRRYGMDADRAICIPFAPSIYVNRSLRSDKDDDAVFEKYGLEPGYLFYPAQFWSHKNHRTLIAALVLLREKGIRLNLVLCGSDRGYRRNVEQMIQRQEISDQVFILGFVGLNELASLYRGARALVMPSYFGPTNLPPLEAWTLDTPVIYPEAFKSQAGEAAILFDYDSPMSLADAITKLDSAELSSNLRIAGRRRIFEFAEQAEEARKQLASRLERLKYRLSL